MKGAIMAEQKTQTPGNQRGGGATEPPEDAAVAPGLVPGDATAPASKAAVKDASAHLDQYVEQVEAELKTLEDGIKQIRSAAKDVTSKREGGLLEDLRNIISEVMHSVPLLRSTQGPRAHIEHRTLPAPDPNAPGTVSATGGEPIL
jgi:hypothetical protein